IRIPNLSTSYVWGPLNVAAYILPRVGERAVAAFVANKSDDLIVLGNLHLSTDNDTAPVIVAAEFTDLPTDPRKGTVALIESTSEVRVFNGSIWAAMGTGGGGSGSGRVIVK